MFWLLSPPSPNNFMIGLERHSWCPWSVQVGLSRFNEKFMALAQSFDFPLDALQSRRQYRLAFLSPVFVAMPTFLLPPHQYIFQRFFYLVCTFQIFFVYFANVIFYANVSIKSYITQEYLMDAALKTSAS
mmetsp:Transcript_2555/g.4897  ORF Transcript_2555/g.4897 Transcript_2555/m.4897 type:complete len:130 (+) Transcript_2555:55-444(+)